MPQLEPSLGCLLAGERAVAKDVIDPRACACAAVVNRRRETWGLERDALPVVVEQLAFEAFARELDPDRGQRLFGRGGCFFGRDLR